MTSFKYTTWQSYYDKLIEDIPNSKPIFENFGLNNILKDLPSPIEPWEYYDQVSKILLDSSNIKSSDDQYQYQFILDAIGQIILALDVVPKLFKFNLDFSIESTKLIELYKYIKEHYKKLASNLGYPQNLIKDDVYINYLNYMSNIPKDATKDYKKLTNHLLKRLDLPYLFV